MGWTKSLFMFLMILLSIAVFIYIFSKTQTLEIMFPGADKFTETYLGWTKPPNSKLQPDPKSTIPFKSRV